VVIDGASTTQSGGTRGAGTKRGSLSPRFTAGSSDASGNYEKFSMFILWNTNATERCASRALTRLPPPPSGIHPRACSRRRRRSFWGICGFSSAELRAIEGRSPHLRRSRCGCKLRWSRTGKASDQGPRPRGHPARRRRHSPWSAHGRRRGAPRFEARHHAPHVIPPHQAALARAAHRAHPLRAGLLAAWAAASPTPPCTLSWGLWEPRTGSTCNYAGLPRRTTSMVSRGRPLWRLSWPASRQRRSLGLLGVVAVGPRPRRGARRGGRPHAPPLCEIAVEWVTSSCLGAMYEEVLDCTA